MASLLRCRLNYTHQWDLDLPESFTEVSIPNALQVISGLLGAGGVVVHDF